MLQDAARRATPAIAVILIFFFLTFIGIPAFFGVVLIAFLRFELLVFLSLRRPVVVLRSLFGVCLILLLSTVLTRLAAVLILRLATFLLFSCRSG